MKRPFRMNRKGVSTVIATIIIVAIAIVMSIAVAYWMLGLGSSFTKYEKVEFVSAYPDQNTTYYTITLKLRNTGSAAATVDNSTIFYNGKPSDASSYIGSAPICVLNGTFDATVTMLPGESATVVVYMLKGSVWTNGMTVEVMIQTSGGSQYPKVVNLP